MFALEFDKGNRIARTIGDVSELHWLILPKNRLLADRSNISGVIGFDLNRLVHIASGKINRWHFGKQLDVVRTIPFLVELELLIQLVESDERQNMHTPTKPTFCFGLGHVQVGRKRLVCALVVVES